ncbi:Peptide deformylase [hydrothermal vent metagenome]|uniref:Peptide deformylase n=1 Tax=hydrothermal vent metagenome TaxID=652676 RepID=A0A3B1A7X8_9ZZZZ
MSLLNILHFPDPRLRTIAQPVEQVNDEVCSLVNNMFETMYAAPGIGLAATQVDIHLRIIVIDITEEKDQPLCLINPEITERDGIQSYEEGCLSIPGFYENVERASTITVKAINKEGKTFQLSTDGLLAVCIQHEMDHLQGKLFVDYISEMKRSRIKKKLLKLQKNQEPVSL